MVLPCVLVYRNSQFVIRAEPGSVVEDPPAGLARAGTLTHASNACGAPEAEPAEPAEITETFPSYYVSLKMRYCVIQIYKILKSQEQQQQELLIVGPRALSATRGQKSFIYASVASVLHFGAHVTT